MPALLALAACSRTPQRTVERIAILPFDNLTGDAAFDWVGTAGPAMLAEELAGASRVLAVGETSAGMAALQGATQLLHCTYTQRGGALEIKFALEDVERHRMVSTGSAAGAVLFAVSTLARTLDAGAQPFSTPNADAAAAWGQPTELEGLAQLTPARNSPSVDCPLVDFFYDPAGTRDEVNTAMVNVRRGFNAYFPMPFQKSVLVRAVNTRRGSNAVISIIEWVDK